MGAASETEVEVNREYAVCARCVMDTSDPLITFDTAGVCNHCRKFEAGRDVLVQRRARLGEVVEQIRRAGRGREYDCVVGVSGGVDSTFVAYKVKQLGLRGLAVHVDNGWNSELSASNIEKIVEGLDIDLYTYVLDWEEFRDLQLAFLKASVVNCEIPTDHAINATLFRVADENGIKFVIHGANTATEGILPVSWVYQNKDFRFIKNIHKRFGTRPLKTFPALTLRRYFYYTYYRRIRFIQLLEYLDYDKKRAMEEIEAVLGWRYYGGKHHESIYTRFYQGYILPRKFKIDKRRAHLATLICSGQMIREDALDELQREPYRRELMEEDKRYVIKKLALSDSKFDRLMALPLRRETEYPSNRRIFGRMRQLKRYCDLAFGLRTP